MHYNHFWSLSYNLYLLYLYVDYAPRAPLQAGQDNALSLSFHSQKIPPTAPYTPLDGHHSKSRKQETLLPLLWSIHVPS